MVGGLAFFSQWKLEVGNSWVGGGDGGKQWEEAVFQEAKDRRTRGVRVLWYFFGRWCWTTKGSGMGAVKLGPVQLKRGGWLLSLSTDVEGVLGADAKKVLRVVAEMQ